MTYSEDFLKRNPELAAIVRAETGKTSKPSKYHNVREEVRGMTFASGHEAGVVNSLILLEEQKQIFGLRLQVRFPLPGDSVYVADACYADDKLEYHVIDAKGYRNREYLRKKRLFYKTYGQGIEEC